MIRVITLALALSVLAETSLFAQNGKREPNGKSGSSRSPDSFFQSLANGSDVLDRSKMNPAMHWMFDRVAQKLNITDGRITKAQFQEYMDQKKSEGSGPPPATTTPNGNGGMDFSNPQNLARLADDSFRRSDQNQDGVLELEEMPEDLQSSLDTWDVNDNGMVDMEEFRPFFIARMQQKMEERPSGVFTNGWANGARDSIGAMNRDGGAFVRPPVYNSSNLPRNLPDWFNRDDSNRDLQVSFAEWRRSHESDLDGFQRMDRNNDGFITVDEVLWHQNRGNRNGATGGFAGVYNGRPNGNGNGRPPFPAPADIPNANGGERRAMNWPGAMPRNFGGGGNGERRNFGGSAGFERRGNGERRGGGERGGGERRNFPFPPGMTPPSGGVPVPAAAPTGGDNVPKP
jgi:hypothetical protein